MADNYAHAVIENPETGTRYERGDKVPDSLAGLDELKKAGAVASKPPKEENEDDE